MKITKQLILPWTYSSL